MFRANDGHGSIYWNEGLRVTGCWPQLSKREEFAANVHTWPVFAGFQNVGLAVDHSGYPRRVAQLLEVLVGTGGLDQTQPAGLRTEAHTSGSPETNALTTRNTPYRMRKAPAR